MVVPGAVDEIDLIRVCDGCLGQGRMPGLVCPDCQGEGYYTVRYSDVKSEDELLQLLEASPAYERYAARVDQRPWYFTWNS